MYMRLHVREVDANRHGLLSKSKSPIRVSMPRVASHKLHNLNAQHFVSKHIVNNRTPVLRQTRTKWQRIRSVDFEEEIYANGLKIEKSPRPTIQETRSQTRQKFRKLMTETFSSQVTKNKIQKHSERLSEDYDTPGKNTTKLILKRYTPDIRELGKRANKSFDYTSPKRFAKRINTEHDRIDGAQEKVHLAKQNIPPIIQSRLSTPLDWNQKRARYQSSYSPLELTQIEKRKQCNQTPEEWNQNFSPAYHSSFK